MGPVLNESGLDDLEKQLSQVLSTFFNRRPEPLNVSRDDVDRHLLRSLTAGVQTQQRLPGAPVQHASLLEDWLDGKSPAQWMGIAEHEWDEKRAKQSDVPGRPIAHSSWAILGTLSLTDTTSKSPQAVRTCTVSNKKAHSKTCKMARTGKMDTSAAESCPIR